MFIVQFFLKSDTVHVLKYAANTIKCLLPKNKHSILNAQGMMVCWQYKRFSVENALAPKAIFYFNDLKGDNPSTQAGSALQILKSIYWQYNCFTCTKPGNHDF